MGGARGDKSSEMLCVKTPIPRGESLPLKSAPSRRFHASPAPHIVFFGSNCLSTKGFDFCASEKRESRRTLKHQNMHVQR